MPPKKAPVPQDACPKCGKGTFSAGPFYTRTDQDGRSGTGKESLAYDCNVCGFRGLLTPCADVPKENKSDAA